ncbi:hypothetical protein Vretimale_20047 [Volvox reticuliferus]|uniref:Uncharacterized protein n=1 Tax=Volvox reticuliferus TaxID=1737510 RepID=A0A8J4H180_9CHLO|nr:hypothetical protein Vretimale_20047 [Volvox reticuliferus]
MLDDEDVDFDYLDKLVEKHQASTGVQPTPAYQQQREQLLLPHDVTQRNPRHGRNPHCQSLQPSKCSEHPWKYHAAGTANEAPDALPYGQQQQHIPGSNYQLQPHENRGPEPLLQHAQQCPPSWHPPQRQNQEQLLQSKQPAHLGQQPQPPRRPSQYQPQEQQLQPIIKQPTVHGASVVAFPHGRQDRQMNPTHQVQGEAPLLGPGGQLPRQHHHHQVPPQLNQLLQQSSQQPQQAYPQGRPQLQQQRPPHLHHLPGHQRAAPHGAFTAALPDRPWAQGLERQEPAPQQQPQLTPHQLAQEQIMHPPPLLPVLPPPSKQQQAQRQEQPAPVSGDPTPVCSRRPNRQLPASLGRPAEQHLPGEECDAGPPPMGNTTAEALTAPVSCRSVTFAAGLGLEDNKRFVVRVGYHDALKAVFELITGASGYNHSVKGWTFPLAQYKHVMSALTDGRLRTRGVQVTVQQTLPEFVGRMLHAAAARPNDERLYDKLTRRSHEGEQSLDEKMMPFQREGVRHALKVGGRVLIGDEMGLGKTVQACCLLKCYSEDWPALVVVPKSLRETWADALFMWLKLTDQDVFVINGPLDIEKLRGSQPLLRPQVIVVSYDTLSRAPEQLREFNPKMVVLDEAQRTKAALPLVQQARRAVLLTGTPALSKPAELVPLLQGLIPSANIKATEFSERYSVPDRRYPGKFFGSRNEVELNRLLQGTVMVRRLKRDVLKHLPAKRRQQVFVRLPDADMRKLSKMSKELEGIKAVADSMMSAGPGSALAGVCREQQQTIMRLWRDTAALKAAAVAEYCADLLEADGAKFLLFAHHQVLLDAVEAKVKSCKGGYIRIDGKTDSVARAEYVKRFQEDSDIKVAILSIQAAGVGLTMTASSLVVFAELSWVPGDIQQAEDRCHRIGQHTSVNIHFLLVRGSIDEIMWDTLQNKLDNVGKVLDGSGAFIKVDVTREVHGLGIAAATVRPASDCESGGGLNTCATTMTVGGPELGMMAVGTGGGASDWSSSEANKAATSIRVAGKAALVMAGTRRISDYFNPAGMGGAGGARAVGKLQDSSEAGIAGKKRGRDPLDEVEVISEDETSKDDFKRR